MMANIGLDTFGIEIEFYGITRQRAIEAVASVIGGQARYVGVPHDRWTVEGHDGRKWSVEDDSSVQARTSSERCEFVSPILKYSDMDTLQEVVRAIRTAGGKSDPAHQCGIHVHIGGQRHNPLTVRNLVNLVYQKEQLVYKCFQVDSHRVRYCKEMSERFLTVVNSRRPATLADMATIWYADGRAGVGGRGHYHDSRYHGLNLHSLFEKGTIEFRLFNGTLHAGLIRSYVVFCLALSQQAVTQKSAKPSRTQTDNDKYTFRCWLLRLGLIGDEFKNVRTHLMANLQGDCAWRDARRLG